MTTRTRQRVSKAAVKSMVGAALAAGLEVQRVEYGRDGKIVVFTGKSNSQPPENPMTNEWDEAL